MASPFIEPIRADIRLRGYSLKTEIPACSGLQNLFALLVCSILPKPVLLNQLTHVQPVPEPSTHPVLPEQALIPASAVHDHSCCSATLALYLSNRHGWDLAAPGALVYVGCHRETP